MAIKDKDTAIRKRQQIFKANRTMFFWVAGVSVIVGFAAVAGLFLARQMIFNAKIITVKNKTISTIKDNQDAIGDLKDNIRALNSNQNLIDLKAQSDDEALQVILDALPADANATALGSSLQNKLLADIPGITLQNLSVENIGEDQSSLLETSSNALSSQSAIAFNMDVSGNAESLKNLLLKLEKSIRYIDISQLTLEQSNNILTLKIEARAFYESPRTFELTNTEVSP